MFNRTHSATVKIAQCTTSADDIDDALVEAVTRRAARLTAGRAEATWSWIALAYAIYWTLFVTGVYTGRPQLAVLGAIVVVATLLWMAFDYLWVRLDSIAFASLAVALITILNLGGTRTSDSTGASVKMVSICVVLAVSRILPLQQASASRARWCLAAPVLFVLALCLFVTPGSSWDSVTRHSGLFVNPNSLALVPFLLLLLIDGVHDRGLIRIGAHAIVIAVLAFSGTSGAVVAYAIGLIVHLAHDLTWAGRIYACALLAIAGSIAAVAIANGGLTLLPEMRLSKQLLIISDEAANFANGGAVNFYGLEQSEGTGSTSGLWRLLQWRRVISVYSGGNPTQKIFGFGAGSSVSLLGKLPHNEYLRLLLEQGAVGFILFVFVWARLIATAPPNIRYVGLIFAIYSITENNLDNFPVMSMLPLCLSARAMSAETDWRRRGDAGLAGSTT